VGAASAAAVVTAGVIASKVRSARRAVKVAQESRSSTPAKEFSL